MVSASAAFACGAFKGTFTLTANSLDGGVTVGNGGQVTSDANDVHPGAGAQTLTYSGGMPQTCGGVLPQTLSTGASCTVGHPGTITISTGVSSGSKKLAASSSAQPPQCQPLGVVINQCQDTNTPARPYGVLGNYRVYYLNGPVYLDTSNPPASLADHGVANTSGWADGANPTCGLFGAKTRVLLGTVTIGAAGTITGTGSYTASSVAGGSESMSGAVPDLATYAAAGQNPGTSGSVTYRLPLSAIPNVVNTPSANLGDSAVCIVDRLSLNANMVPLDVL